LCFSPGSMVIQSGSLSISEQLGQSIVNRIE